MLFTPDSLSQTIFTNVFAFFGTLSPAGFVLSLEGNVFERTTTDPKLLVGQKFSETVYWQSSEHIPELVNKAINDAANGIKSKILLNFRVSAAEIINIEFYLQPLNDGNEIFFCAQEVTDREKEIEFHKKRGEQLLFAAENADIGLWFWDLSEDTIFSTPKCNDYFEIPPHEIITFKSFTDIVHPEDVERVKTALHESQINGSEYKTEYRVIYADGNIHWIAARGRTFLDAEGKPKNMMGLVRRVTDKKLANEELSKVYESEKKARNEAEEANQAKDFFLAVVSHELRSPLNAILGWSKILLTREVDAATRKNALETIEKSARSQAKLIDDLVDSARVSSGKLRLEQRPVNLYEILKTLYFAQRPAAEARKINLEFTPDQENIQVFGDPVRLQQIFTNLLSNAVKFSPADGGTIKINVETGAATVEVSIEDNGQGISAEMLPGIFHQFQQGDNKTPRTQSGLGLGLSIVKILAEKHHGKITAISPGIGQGSKFTVTLPLCGAEVNVSDVSENLITQKTGKPLNEIKILIVEDDADSREVLHLFLEQSGARVISADSASQAALYLTADGGEIPDVIVSDLAMPNEDGYSLIARIRKISGAAGKIPALALSAFASNENKQKAFAAGFQKYHTKPFEPDALIEDIRQLIENISNLKSQNLIESAET